MRRRSLFAVGVLLLAGLTWQIATAAPPSPPLSVCVRTGADVRTPAANGSCPSGYTKMAVSTASGAVGPELVASSQEVLAVVDGGGVAVRSLPLNGTTTEQPGGAFVPAFAQVLSAERTFTTLRVNVRTPEGQSFPPVVTLRFALTVQETPDTNVTFGIQCAITLTSSPTGDDWHTCTSPTGASTTVPAGALVWIGFLTEGPTDTTILMDVATAVS
jgi:hypothetical protein